MRSRLSLALLAALAGFVPVLATAKPPNVLFIAVDDLKPLLGCYGDQTVKSPNIDRLAAQGMLFRSAYCNQAVCAPSRNALFTGIRPETMGIYDLGTNFRRAAPDAVTLPQWLRQHGYRTEAMGKLFHVGHGNHEDAASWSVPHFAARTVEYALPENRAKVSREEALFSNRDAANLPRGAAYEVADVPDNTYGDGRIADEAIKRLQAAKEKPEVPFFMGVGFLRPHLPFCAPKKYWDLYDPASFALPDRRAAPDGAPEFAPTNWGELRNYADMPKQGPLDDQVQRTLIHGYHAAISYMDAQLGRVIDELNRLGLAEETIIVLWGDHGWHLGDHGMWCKHTNYEQATRIPLIVVAPGVTAPKSQTSALVESVDLYPTLCELTGVRARPELAGRSFVPTLKDPSAPTKDAILHVYPRGAARLGRAVRTTRHRLVEWKKPGDPAESAQIELYDYQSDPAETKNLAAEQPEEVSRLRAILATFPEAKPQIAAPQNAGAGAPAKPGAGRDGMFARRDTDRDGKLTRDEFLLNQPDPQEAPKRFTAFDTDKDGVLSKEEFVTMGGKAKP